MSTTKKPTKTTKAALAEKLAEGAAKHFPSGIQLPIEGATLTIPQIQSKLTGFAVLRSDVEAARSNLQSKLAVEAAQAPDMDAFISAFVAIVKGSFGGQPDVLTDFGLPAPKPRAQLTVSQKAAAVAKRTATREARGTKGNKAKQAIHGDVTGVVVTPVTSTKAAGEPTAATGATTAATPASGAGSTTPQGTPNHS